MLLLGRKTDSFMGVGQMLTGSGGMAPGSAVIIGILGFEDVRGIGKSC